MIQFTVKESGKPDTVYHGIRPLAMGVGQADYIAIAWFDGEADLYEIEVPACVNVIDKHYFDLYGRNADRIDVFDNPYKI